MTPATILFALLYYAAFLVLALGIAYRIYGYARVPAPLKIPTTPAPTHARRRGAAPRARGRAVRESVQGRPLAVARPAGCSTPAWRWCWRGTCAISPNRSGDGSRSCSRSASTRGSRWPPAWPACWIRRLFVARVRYISTPSDHLMLALLLAIALSGLAMKFVAHTNIVAVKTFFLGLLYFDWQPLPADGVLYVHLGAGRAADARVPVQQAAARAGNLLLAVAQPGRRPARASPPRAVGGAARPEELG